MDEREARQYVGKVRAELAELEHGLTKRLWPSESAATEILARLVYLCIAVTRQIEDEIDNRAFLIGEDLWAG